MLLQQIHRQREEILSLAADHGVAEVQLFGSVVRGEERPDSDVDFLITLKEWKGLGNYAHFAESLEHMLGRKVDLVMKDGLSPHFAKYILAEAQPL